MLGKIGCIDHYERLKAIVEDIISLSNITKLIQNTENILRFSDTLPIKECTNDPLEGRNESLSELDSVKGKLSVLLNDTQLKFESFRILIKQVNDKNKSLNTELKETQDKEEKYGGEFHSISEKMGP